MFSLHAEAACSRLGSNRYRLEPNSIDQRASLVPTFVRRSIVRGTSTYLEGVARGRRVADLEPDRRAREREVEDDLVQRGDIVQVDRLWAADGWIARGNRVASGGW